MRRFPGGFLAALIIAVSAATAAYASPSPPQGFQPNSPTWVQRLDDWAVQFGSQFEAWIEGLLGIFDNHWSGGSSGAVGAPELDPSEAIAALTLLSGGLAIARARRRK